MGKVGRPRKSDTEGTPQQIKRREYQRQYQTQIKAGIVALEQDEIDCLEELDRIRKEKSRLIDEIAKAKFTAAMASRTNVVLSVPMLLCMIGAGHGGYLF